MATTNQYPLTSRWVRSKAITSAMANSTAPIIEVPAKTLVIQCIIYVETLLAGGTPSIDIGDGDNDDGWIDSVDITEATVGTYKAAAAGHGAYALTGKYYLAADTIDAVVATGLTSGKAYVFAEMLALADVMN